MRTLVCQYWLASPPLALRTATTVKILLKQGRYCKQTFDGSCRAVSVARQNTLLMGHAQILYRTGGTVPLRDTYVVQRCKQRGQHVQIIRLKTWKVSLNLQNA